VTVRNLKVLCIMDRLVSECGDVEYGDESKDKKMVGYKSYCSTTHGPQRRLRFLDDWFRGYMPYQIR
jgi:hypothetical protein